MLSMKEFFNTAIMNPSEVIKVSKSRKKIRCPQFIQKMNAGIISCSENYLKVRWDD